MPRKGFGDRDAYLKTRLRRVAEALAPIAAVALAGSSLGVASLNARALPAASQASRSQGTGPYLNMHTAAQAEVAQQSCDLTQNQLVAMMLSITYGEAGGTVPAPMTHSMNEIAAGNSRRFNLYQSPGPGIPPQSGSGNWWHPGIGLWQMDSAGEGRPWAAFQRIDTSVISTPVADTLANRYCDARSDGDSRTVARRRAYGCNLAEDSCTWFACTIGEPNRCENVYHEIHVNGALVLNKDNSVGSLGGMQLHECHIGGASTVSNCWWINPANSQGNQDWVTAGNDPSPLPSWSWRTFSNEHREAWNIFGAPNSYHAWRSFSDDARGTDSSPAVNWSSNKTICDRTLWPPLGGGQACP